MRLSKLLNSDILLIALMSGSSVLPLRKIGGDEQKKVAPDEIRDIAEAFQILHPETIGQRVYLASRGVSC